MENSLTAEAIDGILTSMEKKLKKILIVDDEEEILLHLCNILKRANFDVISTTKGKEAVSLATRGKPDLIVLDIVLPDLGGSEVASILTENPTTAEIPIIFLTGILTRQEENEVGGKSGRHYVVAKPVTGAELIDMINKILLS